MAKRYYWLKLPDGFFRQKAIKKLRKIAGGDTYTCFTLLFLYLKIIFSVSSLEKAALSAASSNFSTFPITSFFVFP